MSSFNYAKQNEKKYNFSNKNLKSLEYALDNNENINKLIKYNSCSIKNIFSNKKSINDKNINFPLKAKLNDKRNITYENYLILPYKIIGNNQHLRRKNSKITFKNENIYKKNSISLIPFSSKRILTIPTQNYHFGYGIDEKGNAELLEDPNIYDKFNGTKNNSIGPDRYNIITSPRKRLIIDWSKNLDSKNILNNNLLTDIENIKNLDKLDNLFLTNITNINYKNKSIEIKRILSKTNIHKIKESKKDENYYNEILLKHEKQKKEEQSYLGPGSYILSNEFSISPKKIKFQNFGSFMSRNMKLPKKEKNNSIEDNIKYYFLTEKGINKKENKDKKILYKHSKFFTYKLKAEILKEKSITDKNKINENMGPGKYEVKEQKYKKDNNVENFGFLEKRNLNENKNTAWDCFYLPLEDWTKKFKQNNKIKEKRDNILKLIEETDFIQKPMNDNYYKQNLKKEVKVNINYNLNRPGFGSEEPRFYVFESDINTLNGVGKYDLIPKRKYKEKYIPFIYSSKRHNLIRNDNIPDIGPGSYNKFDTFFQWNKKTFNMKIKNRIDEFKNSKK